MTDEPVDTPNGGSSKPNERIAALEDRIEKLEAELQETREQAALDRAHIRQKVVSTEEDIREDLTDQRDALAKEDAKNARRLSAVEDRLDIDASQAFATADGGHDTAHLTPLQRLIRHGPEGAVERPTATHRRAREIALNFGRWGEKLDDKLGKRIRLSARKHAVKSRLEDVTDESLQWNQVHRAMAKVADLSDGRVELLEDGDGKTEGKILHAEYGEIDDGSGE
jgi:predicted Zn-dependent protease